MATKFYVWRSILQTMIFSVILLYLSTNIEAEVFYVSPADSFESCEDFNEPCYTVSYYAARAGNFHSGTTLIFLTGNHNLLNNIIHSDSLMFRILL